MRYFERTLPGAVVALLWGSSALGGCSGGADSNPGAMVARGPTCPSASDCTDEAASGFRPAAEVTHRAADEVGTAPVLAAQEIDGAQWSHQEDVWAEVQRELLEARLAILEFGVAGTARATFHALEALRRHLAQPDAGKAARTAFPALQASQLVLQTYGHLVAERELPFFGATSLAMTDDAALVAVGSERGEFLLWNTQEGRIRSFEGHESGVTCIDLSPDGQSLATGSFDGTVRLWDLRQQPVSYQVIQEFAYGAAAVQFVSNTTVVSAGFDGQIQRWSSAGASPIGQEDISLASMRASDDQRYIALGSDYGGVLLHDLQDPSQPDRIELKAGDWGFGQQIIGLAFDGPRGRLVAATERSISAWPLEGSAPEEEVLIETTDSLYDFEVRGDHLFGAMRDGSVRIWNLDEPWAFPQVMRTHGQVAFALALSRSTNRFSTISNDGTVRLWSAQPPPQRVIEQEAEILSVALHPRRPNEFVALSFQGAINIWDRFVPAEPRRTLGEHLELSRVVYSPEGKQLFGLHRDGRVFAWNTEEYDQSPLVFGSPSWPAATALSADGRAFVAADDGAGIRVWSDWQAEPERSRYYPLAEPDVMSAVALDAEAGRAAVGKQDGTIEIVDLAAEEGTPEVWSVGDPWRLYDEVTALAFSPDHQRLAAGFAEGTMALWSLGSRRELQLLPEAHQDAVTTLNFNSTSDRLVSSGGFDDGTIRLWNLAANRLTRKESIPIAAHDGIVTGLDTGPSHELIVSGGSDRTIRIFDLEGRRLWTTLCQRLDAWVVNAGVEHPCDGGR